MSRWPSVASGAVSAIETSRPCVSRRGKLVDDKDQPESDEVRRLRDRVEQMIARAAEKKKG